MVSSQFLKGLSVNSHETNGSLGDEGGISKEQGSTI